MIHQQDVMHSPSIRKKIQTVQKTGHVEAVAYHFIYNKDAQYLDR